MNSYDNILLEESEDEDEEDGEAENQWEKEFPDVKFPPEIEMLGFSSDDILKEFEAEIKSQRETTLIFIGNTDVGKTTLISKFLGIEEPIKKTLALEYYYSRRHPVDDSSEDYGLPPLCNVWELGNGTLFGTALEPLNEFKNVTGVICVDLSAPEGLWTTMESMLDILNKYAKAIPDFSDMKAKMKSQVPKDHPDLHILTPISFPLVIVGCKYDYFQKFEPEMKKVVCQTLRYWAHMNCAQLFFYSDLILNMFKTAKEVLDHYAFNTPACTKTEFNYNKAICIPPFADTLAKIDPTGKMQSMESYKSLLEAHFPQVNPFTKMFSQNPSKDPDFAEPRIDALRDAKDDELEKMIKEFEEESKLKRSTKKTKSRSSKIVDENIDAALKVLENFKL